MLVCLKTDGKLVSSSFRNDVTKNKAEALKSLIWQDQVFVSREGLLDNVTMILSIVHDHDCDADLYLCDFHYFWYCTYLD